MLERFKKNKLETFRIAALDALRTNVMLTDNELNSMRYCPGSPFKKPVDAGLGI
jgi:hypothetical protein